jgi:hypothetical protein
MADRNRDNATQDLLQAREELRARLDDLDRLLERAQPEADPQPAQKSRSPKRPVRAKVLDALDDLGWPTYTRQIGPYIEARTGDRVAPTRFGALARDEQASFRSSRARPVYLGFALTSVRGEAIKRLLVRSDWELERRIVAPTTGRVQHLMLTIRFCELATELEDLAAQPERLRFLAADHARDLPGVKVRHGQFDLKDWAELARVELERVRQRDAEQRAEAAALLRHRPEHALLFGLPEVLDGDGAAAAVIEGHA